ncbi:MAG: WD40/YVTN/BNR-like repeat-containing protein, partial [Bacteroidia bacterium]
MPLAAQNGPLDMLDGLKFRNIGPFRGGRSAAVTGVPGQPNLFYMGAAGGGVWRTKDAGQRWENISDGFFGGSIGAVAVSEWDPNVIYVGGGEVTVRGNVSYGYGMWKSVDAGASWTHAGLPKSKHIPRVRIHPKNPDLVYAAVLGDLFADSEERGVYRSKDGGKTWERILYTNSRAGAVDLTFDPTNPRILYASTWNVRRTPYSLESGGPGSALWKSTDGGDTWTNMMDKPGLPDGPIGIIGVTVSPVNPQRVWAIIEAPEGGVFRSDDGGKKWVKINAERKLRQRAWYYTRIYADTRDIDKVYVVNVGFHRSKDGGKSWKRIRTPHGDHHDLWIAPEDPLRMIIGDDGGAQVSLDAGDNWSTYQNQPTAQ